MWEEVAAGVVEPVSLPRWAHPVKSTSLWTRPPWPTSSATSFSSQEVSSTPGLTSRDGHGGVLYSARRGLRTKEERENWGERKGKKTTPEGTQFLTLSHPFVSDNNELCERKGELSS